MKLMYLADRDMLTRHGKPITYDRWVLMKHGPVLSATYDLIKARGNGYWHRHLRTTGYCVERVADAGSDNLSPAEQRVITWAFDRYGHLDTWALRDFTHELEEWRDPGQTARPITYGDVLRIEGLPDDEIVSVLDNITGHDVLDRVTARP
jgi:uncharacterized phage-associated protein